MEEEYILVTIDVFDQKGNQAKVRKNVTIGGLIDEILREFDDLDRRIPHAYAIYLKNHPQPLDRNRTLAQLDIQPRDELEFRYARRSQRESLPVNRKAYLHEESTRRVFELRWQPALIGRPDADPAHNELLAVNCEQFHDGLRVSRRHAQITADRGEFYIESLSPNNPTYLNEEELFQRKKLLTGDRIRLGRTQITFVFVLE
jgi:pSer/pThr/pTyr-binding forkhead associated (FHA) protein